MLIILKEKGGDSMEIYNKRIHEMRIQRKKVLKDVANYLGVAEATVQRYESGKGIKSIPYETITKIAKFLECTPAYLMGWEDIEEKAKTANKVIEDEGAMRLIKYYSLLTEEQKKNAEIFLKALCESNKK